jgi:hypothetical protein
VLQVCALPYPAALIRRSLTKQGVTFKCGVDLIAADFATNTPLVDFILSLRAPLSAEGFDEDSELETELDAADLADDGVDEPVVVRRGPGVRRALLYDEADKTEWKTVPEGKDSWQQFFSDSQVAKLVTSNIAIFSAYDNKRSRVLTGKFQLCFKVDGIWRCKCADCAVRETCSHTLSAARLDAKQEKPLFSADDAIYEVEPKILWVVQDTGVSYQPVYQRADLTVRTQRVYLSDSHAGVVWRVQVQTSEPEQALFSRCARMRAFRC